MKKILLILFLLITSRTFGQAEKKTVQYFGGVYDNTAYFNWVLHNTDTCRFIVEMSYDGETYEEVFRKTFWPVPVPILHGMKLPACDDVWFRLITITEGYITTFKPEMFCKNKYTFEPRVCACRVIHVDL